MKIMIKATPGAKKSAILGWEEHPDCASPVLRVKIAAPPIDGKANKLLVSFLADALQLRRSEVKLLHGEGARLKLIEIPDEAQARLELHLKST